MNKHPNCTFNEFTQVLCKNYHKVQTDEQIYMTLRTVKQNMNERVEEYYEWIFNLANSLQHSTNNHMLNVFFRVGLLATFRWLLSTWRRELWSNIWRHQSFVRKTLQMLTIIGSYWTYTQYEGKKNGKRTLGQCQQIRGEGMSILQEI